MPNKNMTASGELVTIYLEYQNLLAKGKTVQDNKHIKKLSVNGSQTKSKPEPAYKLPQEIDEVYESAKDAVSNLSTATKTDETTEVKRSSTQDFISEEKEVQASKLSQDVNVATKTTKDDDSTHSTAIKEEEITEKKRRGIYRTKAKAGKIDKVPSYLPVITLKDYRSALTINNDSSAHLLLLPVNSKLEYEDKILYLNGQIASYDEVTKLSTDDGIEKINFPLLSELFGVILYKFESDSKNECKDEEFTVYYPDLASCFRKSKTKKKNTDEDVSDDKKQKDVGVINSDWKSESATVLNNNMTLFGRMAGVINPGTPNQLILPVLTDYGYDPASNTFHFRSPYMTKLISVIHRARIKKNKNGKLEKVASYSFLVDRAISQERNKKAVEIALIIVTLIEEAGDMGAHIKTENIINRTCLLKHSLNGQKTSNKNLLLKRAFSKAWELLDTRTALKKKYIKLQLPKPENVPTSSKLDKVFKFPHEGTNEKFQLFE